MYPYFLFAAIHHLKSSPTFSVRPCSSVGIVTEDLMRRSWVRFPPRSKDFFFASCGSLFPFTRANAQWVIHGLSSTIIYSSELILCSIIIGIQKYWAWCTVRVRIFIAALHLVQLQYLKQTAGVRNGLRGMIVSDP